MSNPSPYAPPAAAPSALPKPSPVIAVLLTLVCGFGLGHVYAGDTKRALAWAASPIALVIVIAGLVHGARGIAPTLGVGLAAFVLLGAVIADAARTAARSPSRAPTLRIVLCAMGIFAFGAGLRVVTRYALLEAFKIPAGSMMPTLLVGDHIFIDKTGAAKRGDVVVFPFPEHPEQDFVKRVVGLPGDRLEFKDGHPIVNGVPVPSCRVGEWSYEEDGTKHAGDLFAESLDGHVHLAFYDQSPFALAEYQGPYEVKPGELFMIGDNRNNSHDSRMWFGGNGAGVPSSTLRGVAFAVWLSAVDERVDWTRAGNSIDAPTLPTSAAPLAPQLAKCLAQLAPH